MIACGIFVNGIIPARAGSRISMLRALIIGRDHPRACGEQPSCAPKSTMRMGSSPRVRGAGETAGQGIDGGGIIPARAGSRPAPWRWSSGRRDHPRACGEQVDWPAVAPRSLGSSPRVRGAVPEGHRPRQGPGIIPARAGSRIVENRYCHLRRDHPRACGEQFVP